jgi:multidrug efflux pump subunit AcrA (membrane-fusion protein)
MSEIDRGPDIRPDDGPAATPGAGTGAPGTRHAVHQPPPGAAAMNTLRWVLFAGLLVLAVASVGGYLMSRRSAGRETRQAKAARYRCPMHPSYTSDRPGECPICGMTLEPIPEGDARDGHQEHAGDVPGLTTVHLTPDRVQLIGVRTARVERQRLGGELELVGFVAPDETRFRRIQLRVSGWVQQLDVNRTGETVEAGQPLLSIYSPELLQSEKEFLIELDVHGDMGAMAHEARAGAAARQRLELLGIPDEEIRRLERERTAAPRLTLRAPVAGTVLEKNVVEGQYVGPDTPLFTVADLSRVWVLADLYEMDLGRVRVGDIATFATEGLPGRRFEGLVEFIYPTVSSETRTLKARVSLPNGDGLLRPGMYGSVTVSGRAAGAGLTVPSEAVVNTGDMRYVFLAHDQGLFEPRRVWVGQTRGERVQILRGVAEGDTVVASASFLIDSESRLKAAISGLGTPPAGGHSH